MLEPKACRAQLGSASTVPHRPKGRGEKWTLEPQACLHKKVQGDGNIRLRAPIPQNCHSRESGNLWSYISAHDTILVRTKTRRPGATSLCLRAFVRTILPTVRPMGSRFRGNDKLRSSRRGAEDAEAHSSQRHAGAEGVQSTTRFSIHRATRTEG
jgi:hypothetical protein